MKNLNDYRDSYAASRIRKHRQAMLPVEIISNVAGDLMILMMGAFLFYALFGKNIGTEADGGGVLIVFIVLIYTIKMRLTKFRWNKKRRNESN